MKNERHGRIRELISEFEIETQEELVDRLRALGYDVTQATVSRDIRALKLSKVTLEDGRQKYAVTGSGAEGSEKYIRILRDGITKMDATQNILVIKTSSGLAMAVAAALENIGIEEIIGCIAGDDTIFCAVSSKETAQRLQQRIHALIV